MVFTDHADFSKKGKSVDNGFGIPAFKIVPEDQSAIKRHISLVFEHLTALTITFEKSKTGNQAKRALADAQKKFYLALDERDQIKFDIGTPSKITGVSHEA